MINQSHVHINENRVQLMALTSHQKVVVESYLKTLSIRFTALELRVGAQVLAVYIKTVKYDM